MHPCISDRSSREPGNVNAPGGFLVGSVLEEAIQDKHPKTVRFLASTAPPSRRRRRKPDAGAGAGTGGAALSFAMIAPSAPPSAPSPVGETGSPS
jgi:hypothetical protein